MRIDVALRSVHMSKHLLIIKGSTMNKAFLCVAIMFVILGSVSNVRAQAGRGVGSPSDLPPGVKVAVPGGDLAQKFRDAYPEFQTELGAGDADFSAIVQKIDAIGNARNQLSGVPGVDPGAGNIRIIEQGHINPRTGILQKPPAWQTRHLPLAMVALYELNDAVNDPNAPPEVIKARLENYRAVRTKYLADVKVAMDSLRAILNQKQEAILVSYGYLD
jgi:hypothetical protein